MRPTIPGSRPSHTTRSAFTLVELLAVLCVLAALLTLLSTALARTPPNSKSFQCLNNLRQLGLAQTMYATENRDMLAYPNWNPPWIMGGWLYNGSAGSPPNPFAAPYVTNPTLAYAGGSLWPYLKNMGVYRCPLDKTNATSFAQRANKLSTYLVNGAVCGYGGLIGASYKRNDFTPDQYIMWEPDDNLPFSYNDGSSYPSIYDGGPNRRHGLSGALMLTFGGNVVVVPYRQWTILSESAGPNELWCNPGSPNGH